MRPPLLFLSSLFVVLAACTNVPELQERLTDDLRNAKYPALVPLDQALKAQSPKGDEAQELEDSLTARRDGLQNRAKALNETEAVDEETRLRMQQGVSG
ncbi:hypothetical protein [Primorskyibacter sp. S87]|uniref:hypothetical protein n=1 Tax=Primorskyibacter sp. S87 TaxID=3415126 RepID=UPI003C79F8AD